MSGEILFSNVDPGNGAKDYDAEVTCLDAINHI
jgi:hypothetical protein